MNKNDWEELVKKYDDDYNNYVNELEKQKQMLYTYRDLYNNLVSLINAERVAMRYEINDLYSFLKNVGGNIGKNIDIFEFDNEDFAPVFIQSIVLQLEKPVLKDEFGIFNINIKGMQNSAENKDKKLDFQVAVDKQRMEYTKSLQQIKNEIKYLTDIVKIAEIYRNTIIMVKDCIRYRVIPEADLIESFLYADAIRESIVENNEISSLIVPCDFNEYRGSIYDLHVRFIENAFDFYKLCTSFFKNKVLTNIIADKKVSHEEKDLFMKQVESIRYSMNKMEVQKVIC